MAIRLEELETMLTKIWTEHTPVWHLMSKFELTSGEVQLLCQSDSTVKVQQATLAALKAGRSLRLPADSFNLVSDNYESPRCIIQVNEYNDVYDFRDFFTDTEGLEYVWLPQRQALGVW
jgi:hypothetical protein